jgi:hypothetical protein
MAFGPEFELCMAAKRGDMDELQVIAARSTSLPNPGHYLARCEQRLIEMGVPVDCSFEEPKNSVGYRS